MSGAQKAALAAAAGADAVIDYRRENVAERVREATPEQGVDRISEVDIAANAALDVELLRSDGELVVYGSGTPQFSLTFFPLIAKNVRLQFFIVYHLSDDDRRRAIGTLTGLLERGALVHNIAERLPLEQIAHAHELVEQGRSIGNVVLRIPPSGV